MFAENTAVPTISKTLSLDKNSVYSFLKLYLKEGFEGRVPAGNSPQTNPFNQRTRTHLQTNHHFQSSFWMRFRGQSVDWSSDARVHQTGVWDWLQKRYLRSARAAFISRIKRLIRIIKMLIKVSNSTLLNSSNKLCRLLMTKMQSSLLTNFQLAQNQVITMVGQKRTLAHGLKPMKKTRAHQWTLSGWTV